MCEHLQQFAFKAPTGSTKVYKDECTQCFESVFSHDGIRVCLTCFNGSCRSHSEQHFNLTRHPLVMKIRKIKKSVPTASPTAANPTKVQIVEHAESDIYETITAIFCFTCKQDVSSDKEWKFSASIINAVHQATSAKQKSDIKAWEEEVAACEHSLCIDQEVSQKKDLSHCFDCNLKTNLWLCLICGNIGCGRKQFDGSGGNNHGIDHFQKTGHLVSCKLGTISAEGTAGIIVAINNFHAVDIFCYRCDDMKVDPYLAEHLAAFGIKVDQQSKTEKSMAELQLEQNLKFEFNMVSEDGKSLQPVFGPSLTGLKNIGNSCYLASVIQATVHSSLFSHYAKQSHIPSCRSSSPASCYKCQMEKLSYGLASGNYSKPSSLKSVENGVAFQDGVPPTMFKDLVTKDHQEFSSARQQDAYEFLQFLMEYLDKEEPVKPSKDFTATLSSRVQCQKCYHVGYSKEATTGISIPLITKTDKPDEETVPLSNCINALTADEAIEDFKCAVCNGNVIASKRTRFVTFPKFLVLQLQRFVLENWVPKKLNTNVVVDAESLDLSAYEVTGEPQAGEQLFPEDQAPEVKDYSDAHLEQLISMGFTKNRSIRALKETKAGAEVAMEWLFTKMDDPTLDDPIIPAQANAPKVDEGLIQGLMDMGFTKPQAKRALKETKNNMEQAVEWLFSNPNVTGEEEPQAAPKIDTVSHGPQYKLHAIIAHKGTSTHCGHYVAYVRHESGWVLFNDEKVAKLDQPISMTDGAGNGYLYVFGH